MSDTPRTDAVWEAAGRGPMDGPEKWLDAVARNMERELADAEAEVAELRANAQQMHRDRYEELNEVKASVNALLHLVADIREAVGDPTGKLMQDELVEHCKNLLKRAEKAETKVQRLRVNLLRAIEIAKYFRDQAGTWNQDFDQMDELSRELACTAQTASEPNSLQPKPLTVSPEAPAHE